MVTGPAGRVEYASGLSVRSPVIAMNRASENASQVSASFAPGPVALAALILVAALTRLLPHPPNFSPVEAIALFGGAYFASRTWAVLVPLWLHRMIEGAGTGCVMLPVSQAARPAPMNITQ